MYSCQLRQWFLSQQSQQAQVHQQAQRPSAPLPPVQQLKKQFEERLNHIVEAFTSDRYHITRKWISEADLVLVSNRAQRYGIRQLQPPLWLKATKPNGNYYESILYNRNLTSSAVACDTTTFSNGAPFVACAMPSQIPPNNL